MRAGLRLGKRPMKAVLKQQGRELILRSGGASGDRSDAETDGGVDMTSVVTCAQMLGRVVSYKPALYLLSVVGHARVSAEMGQYCRRLILLISVDRVPPYCDPSRACLTLGTRVGRGRLFTSSRIARKPGPHSRRRPESQRSDQAVTATSFAIAHMKAMSSRAIAVTTTLGCVPRPTSRRTRLHSRTCAFHPRS